VRTRFVAERAAQLAEDRAKSLAAELGKAGGDARQKMQELSAQPDLELGKTDAFLRQGAVAPLGMAPAVNAAAFGLKKGGVSEPVRTPRGWVVLHLAEVRPPHLPQLSEVRDAVRRAVEQDKQRQQAFDKLQQARATFGPGATLDQVAGALGIGVQESQEFGHGGIVPGLGYAPELAEKAMTQPLGRLAGPVGATGSAVLYEVASRTGVDPAAFAQQKDSLRDQLEQEKINAILGSLINAKKQELGVTYDPQLLKRLGLEGSGAPPRA
jgi:peptidyl-prolyl cis-trans isomerase D